MKNRWIWMFAVYTCVCMAMPGHAGTTWTGAGGDASWGTAGNWGGASPAFDGTETLTFAGGSGSGLATTLDGTRDISALTLSSGSDFTIAQGSGGTLKLKNITVSTFTYAITAPVELTGNGVWNSSGPVSINLTVSGGVSDGGNGYGIDKTGGRHLRINGVNTYTGPTTITSGSLYLGGTSMTTNINVNGGALWMDSDTALGTGPLNANGGDIYASADRTITNALVLGSGKITDFDGRDHTYTQPVEMLGDHILSIRTDGVSDVVEFSDGITDGGNGYALDIRGSRYFYLKGASTYTGPTTIGTSGGGSGTLWAFGTMATTSVTFHGGSIFLAADNPLGVGTLTISGAAACNMRISGTRRVFDNNILMKGNLEYPSSSNPSIDYNKNSGTTLLTGNLTFTQRGSTALANAPKFFNGIGESGGSYGLTFSVNSPSSRYINLSGNSTYTGPTVINGGIIYLGNANALPTNTALTITFTSTTDSVLQTAAPTRIGSLSGNGYLHNLGKTLTIGGSTNTTYTGQIVSSGGLTKTGSGIQSLASAMAYTGPTIVSGGVLRVDGVLNSSAATVTAVDGGILAGTGTINRATTVTAGGAISAGNASNSVGELTVASTVTMTNGAKMVWAQDVTSNDVVSVNNLTLGNGITVEVHNLGVDVDPSDEFILFKYSGSLSGFSPASWTVDGSKSATKIATGDAVVSDNGSEIRITGLQAPPPPAGTVLWLR